MGVASEGLEWSPKATTRKRRSKTKSREVPERTLKSGPTTATATATATVASDSHRCTCCQCCQCSSEKPTSPSEQEQVRWRLQARPEVCHTNQFSPLRVEPDADLPRSRPELATSRLIYTNESEPRHHRTRISRHCHNVQAPTTATTTTKTTATTNSRARQAQSHEGRWWWWSWSSHKTTTPAPYRPTQLLLVILATCCCLLQPMATPSVESYQLANNLIANNLPPKFVQATGGAGPGSSGSGSSGSSSTSSEIVVRVKEGPQSIGKLIYTLKGEDPDEDPLTFGVLGTVASDLLRVENVPGNQANIYLRKELDRETTESHQVVITLTDGKLGRGNWVEDVNDNHPVFGPHRTAISIREDAKVPLVIESVEASDADEGRFGQVIYKLDETAGDQFASDHWAGSPSGAGKSSRVGDMFAIETIDGRGVISLIGQLNYEQRPLYQLRVLAIDRAHENERLSASTSILISVEDCEDQPPMFTFTPSITRIPEDLAVGSDVVRVSAIDGDRGVNNPIKYSLVSVNNQEAGFERNLFSIGSDSGQISVAHELDRELSLSGGGGGVSGARSSNQPGVYVLQVRATEVSSSSSSASLLDGLLFSSNPTSSANSVTTELTVILVDVNDELPTFSQARFYGELLENSPGESLVSFIAPPHQSTAAASKEQPQQQPVAAEVVDRDQGTNGTFTLHLEGEHGHLFEVWPTEATNEAKLMVKVSSAALEQPANAKYFDFESRNELRLTIVAREKYGPEQSRRFTTADMVIYLKDANDNYPQFESELYRVEIPESAIRGMHICAVKALDSDSGPLGTAGIRYTEIRGERANKFKLDPVTGVVTLKTNEHGFDRETIAQHHLIVEARDNMGLGNRNTTQLLIVLADVNDQRPKFLLDQYEAFIYENEPDFQSPLQVQASDEDAPNSPNSRITYSIVGGDPQQNFTIDPATGRIRVRTQPFVAPGGSLPARQHQHQQQPADSNIVIGNGGGDLSSQVTGLDFERIAQRRDETRHFNLTIRAQDSGLPEPLAATTKVIVIVYDTNDHAPVFTRPTYSKSLREDLPGGSPVIQVQAHDGDHSPTNSKITYRLSSGGSDKFVIDSDSGLISIANGANLDIDRVQGAGQRRTNYQLTVLASDGSFGHNQKSSSALVNITIIDVNNKVPEFISLSASTSKQQQHQSSLGTVATSQQQQQQQTSVIYVNEDAPYGLVVTRVFAHDLDSSAELRYSINYARSEARNEDMLLVEPSLYRDVFAIEPSDGTIKVNKQLDRELFDQVKLRLQVEDLAAQSPDQVAHAHLLVRITDTNDNRPTFKRPLYKAVVNENSISGTSVITMSADDRDLNKTLRYSLEAGSPDVARLVRINPRSGEVTVNDKIDRELFPLINVTVKAEDFGQPHSLTGSAQLIITVRDENDNNPIFLNEASHLRPLQARHSHPPSTSSSDKQQQQPSNHNNNNNNNNFLSGPSANSYRLRSLGPPNPSAAGRFLNEDQPPVLDLTEDQFGSARGHHHHQQPPLPVPTFDESGRELALLAPGATARVREDAPLGHQIAYVRAEDADVGNNGRVTYLLDANSSGGGKFRIDRDLGVLSVAQPLDREQQKHYTLIIEACDNFDLGYSTGESRRAFTQVNIQVTDINDNAPTISTNLQQQVHRSQASLSSSSSSASSSSAAYPSHDEAMNSQGPYELPLAECLFINEFQPPNEPILTITASDPDDPETPNGQVDLAIINNVPQNEMFSLVPVRSVTANLAPTFTLQSGPTGNEPVTLTTTSMATSLARSGRQGHPPPETADDLGGFGDQLAANHPEKWPERRSKRSVSTLEQLDSGNFYAPASPASGLRLNSARLAGSSTTMTTTTTTTTPPTSPTTTVSSSSQMRSPDSGTGLLQAQQSSAGGQHQIHLVVSQSLRERVGNYSILVRATDRGQPTALSSVKLINVCVQDVNNHAPLFTRPPLNHTIRIMENATIGSYVTQVEATDLDHGLNGELQYSLKPTNIQNNNNDWQSFKIDRLSGVITTQKLFNRQLKKYYTLRAQAQDFGRPTSLSSDIDINIVIVNSGKYQPEFEQQHQSLQFSENSAPGSEWFRLVQTTNLDDDPALINANVDTNANSNGASDGSSAARQGNWLASPCYYIVDGDDLEQVFHLDRYSHRLTNQKELDRERKANYTLIVQASNNCNRPSGGMASSSQLLATMPSNNNSNSNSNNEVSLTTSASVGLFPLNDRIKRSATSATPSGSRTAKTILARKEQGAASEKLVAAVNGELTRLAALDALVADDKSLLKVSIKIKDVNDNAPKFTQKIYTGGITTEADFGTVFMIVQAIDADADQNGQVAYSIVKPIKRSLSLNSNSNSNTSQQSQRPPVRRRRHSPNEDEPPVASLTTTTSPTGSGIAQFSLSTYTTNELYQSSSSSNNNNNLIQDQGSPLSELGPQMAEGDDLFVVNAQTGEISLNFDPQKHMKGYFEFEIQARDPDGLWDSARVLIYLLRQDQRVKFVLRLTPQELRQRLNKFRSVFGNITGAIVNIDSYKYFENHDGTVDKKKTSLFLHFVQPEDNTIIEVDKVLTLIDNNIEYLDELYKEFHVLSSEAAHLPLSSGALVDPIDQVRTGLMGVASFLALILVLVIALCLNQRTRYERQLKAATVSAFGSSPLHLDPDFHTQTNLPNTNLHSQDPNPIWINGHHYGAGSASGQDLVDVGRLAGWAAREAALGRSATEIAGKRAGSRQQQAQEVGGGLAAGGKLQHRELFHSGGSPVGMAQEEDGGGGDELDGLSTSGGDHSASELNSLSGGLNSVAHHHHHHHHHHQLHHYNVATAATATPRDSLTSSQRQASSSVSSTSSGSNSASTTNERQVLCSNSNSNNNNSKQQSATATTATSATTTTTTGTSNRNRNQTKVKLNSTRPISSNNLDKLHAMGTGTNSTFGCGGAYKEVTIYTEQRKRAPLASDHQQQATAITNKTSLIRTTANNNNNNNNNSQPTSHVNRLATQFNASKVHTITLQQQKQPIDVTTATNLNNVTKKPQQHQPPPLPPPTINQQQKTRILVHSNGADVNQGIIKAPAVTKHSTNNLDAKFVPAQNNNNNNARTATVTTQQQQQQQQQQDQSVNNFEASLSKLSILNLETTEL